MHHHHNQVPGAALGGDAADGGIPRAAAALDAAVVPALEPVGQLTGRWLASVPVSMTATVIPAVTVTAMKQSNTPAIN